MKITIDTKKYNKFCPNCGRLYPADHNFCPKCDRDEELYEVEFQ